MDMMKMGSFLAKLRKENNLTQAELGEKLGVTNKTISRWETGTYMPPVEMLGELSNIYGLSINEILSGKRLTEEEYKEMAETNIKETLNASTFGIKEKQEFYKKKWLHEHIALIVVFIVVWLGIIVGISLKGAEIFLTAAIGGMLALMIYTYLYNRMMAYVEDHIYGGKWNSLG